MVPPSCVSPRTVANTWEMLYRVKYREGCKNIYICSTVSNVCLVLLYNNCKRVFAIATSMIPDNANGRAVVTPNSLRQSCRGQRCLHNHFPVVPPTADVPHVETTFLIFETIRALIRQQYLARLDWLWVAFLGQELASPEA